ncbi:fimbrial protein [Erwiniaceae bacterium CAU 1747]
MFKKISILFLLLNMSAANPVYSSGTLSADSDHGRVIMTGSIIDTACAISTGSLDQTVDMGAVPVSRIIRDGQGAKKDFSINLVKCILERHEAGLNKWQYFTITFDGFNDDGLFSVAGEAKGVAIRISDRDGNVASPGVALPPGEIEAGDMSLNFSMQLVSNHQALHAGEYNSIIKFKMDYE